MILALDFLQELWGGGYYLYSKETYTKITGNKFSLINDLQLSFSPRIGLSLVLHSHHRLELLGQIPVYVIDAGENDLGKVLINHPIQVMIGYKYVF